jgi:hypothetical protein
VPTPWANRSATASPPRTSTATDASRSSRRRSPGRLYVWDRKGKRRPASRSRTEARFSQRSARDRFNRLQRGIVAAPVLVDLDGDPKTLEIVAAAMDRHVYVWRPDATPLPGFPVQVVDRTQMASIDPVTHHVVPRR